MVARRVRVRTLHWGKRIMTYAVDVWRMTVVRLGEAPTGGGSVLEGLSRRLRIGATGEPIVRILEQPTAQTLIVSWCDARSGHYGYQTWRTVVARVPGVCALTGRSIEVGDAIYKPRLLVGAPANADAMICAKSVGTIKQCN